MAAPATVSSGFRVMVWELAGEAAPFYSVQWLAGLADVQAAEMRPDCPTGESWSALLGEVGAYRQALSMPWVHVYGIAYEMWLPDCVMRYRELESLTLTESVYRVGLHRGQYAVYRQLRPRVVSGPWAVVARSEMGLLEEMARLTAAMSLPVLDLAGFEVRHADYGMAAGGQTG